MDPSRLNNTFDSNSQHPRFPFYNDSLSNLVSNDNKNEELNWGLFTNTNQFLDVPSFPFNSNVSFLFTKAKDDGFFHKIDSAGIFGSYSGFDSMEEKTDVSDFNIQSQTRATTSSSISGNNMEQSMKSQVVEWNSQPKQIDFSMEMRKVEPESLQSLQTHYSSDQIQATKEQSRYEDGYNWRKYGQKKVKGSKKPRSYFKCSYPDCPMRKKVEKDTNGYITEIVYNGKHSHPKPQNMKKSSSSLFQDTMLHHSVEKTSYEPFSERSLVSFGEDEYEQGSSNSKLGDDRDNEPEAKRWKSDEAESEAISHVGSKTLQDTKVVIQTRSEIDLLDDGYRWRKYGQKVVKGNPNPRSYYKCTNNGCPVRKLVERASNDPQDVITTYEGKHNHHAPKPRGGGGGASSSTISHPSSSFNTAKIGTNYGPLLNYSSNINGQTPNILQTLENSNRFFESSYPNQFLTKEFSSRTKEEPQNEIVFNSFFD
ncbi:hypothetical protein OSB04_024836 [Centaurea solstitialis]|uniref:WRKY domain-containing protein n=1 Tax=Centaurea solstitialis TaxID=347529 RepID=A0AA38SLX9_9ASTR|nr:hypothetical protein OSB04_024836 [Centaurea solstitialis]